MQDGLIRAIPMRHGSNSLVQPQTEVPAQALQNQIMVFQSAGGQPLCNIRADGNLAGFAAIVQAILAVYILWLVMEAAEAYPTAATLEPGTLIIMRSKLAWGVSWAKYFVMAVSLFLSIKEQGPHLYT